MLIGDTVLLLLFFFSSRRRHTRCALVTGVQTCALPICFAVERFGVEAFDNRLIAVDEFHHVSANPDNVLGKQLGEFIARDKVHILAMTGSYFRGDAEAVLAPQDEANFDTVTYTYYEQLNGYEFLKSLDIGYFFYSGAYS